MHPTLSPYNSASHPCGMCIPPYGGYLYTPTMATRTVNARSKQVPIRFPHALHAAVRLAAEREGQSLAGWVLAACNASLARSSGVTTPPPHLAAVPVVVSAEARPSASKAPLPR